jgi:hypothetical protein
LSDARTRRSLGAGHLPNWIISDIEASIVRLQELGPVCLVITIGNNVHRAFKFTVVKLAQSSIAMSYPGVPGPGNNGYWNGYGHDPPDFNGMPKALPQPVQNGSNHPQYHTPPSNGFQIDQRQNAQIQYNQRSYSNQPSINPMQPSLPIQPPTIHPQFINPAQLFQQSPPQYQSHPPASFNRQVIAPASNTSIKMAPSNHAIPQLDRPALLMSLAEEYFDAAHSLAPSVSVAMTAANVETYEKLISTGLACLDTAMKNVRLPPRVEANIRLRYAGILYEETENFMEAEITLSKGIALCERVRICIPLSVSF